MDLLFTVYLCVMKSLKMHVSINLFFTATEAAVIKQKILYEWCLFIHIYLPFIF